MTLISGPFDKSLIYGKTLFLKIGEEYGKHRYLYIGGHKVTSFLTDDDLYKYISKMGNSLISYSIAIGKELIYFLFPHFKFIKWDRIEDSKYLKTNKN